MIGVAVVVFVVVFKFNLILIVVVAVHEYAAMEWRSPRPQHKLLASDAHSRAKLSW